MTTTGILATLNWEEVDLIDMLFIMENLYEVHGREKVNEAIEVAMAQAEKMSKKSN